MATFIFYDDMLRNVILKEEKPSGGAAVQTYAWIRGLMANGQNVYAMTNFVNVGQIKDECRDIKLIPLYDANKGIRWIRWVYYRIPYFFYKLKSNRPDYFVQGIPHWTSFILGLICFLLNIKFIIRVSCDHLIDERFYQFHSRAHKLLLNLGFSFAYAIICQNEYQFNILKIKYPLKKIVKLSNPFYNKPVINILPFNLRHYIAWIGLFQYQKNMKLLFEIASRLKDEKIKIAGRETFGHVDSETKVYIDKLHNLKNVEFVGFLDREKVIEFLYKAKYLLCTSHFEGFSNTFLEAMICGTPVLTTEKANPDSIISEFKLGHVYKDTSELFEKIRNLSEQDFIKMSNNSINYVGEYHNYITIAKKLINFLEE